MLCSSSTHLATLCLPFGDLEVTATSCRLHCPELKETVSTMELLVSVIYGFFFLSVPSMLLTSAWWNS